MSASQAVIVCMLACSCHPRAPLMFCSSTAAGGFRTKSFFVSVGFSRTCSFQDVIPNVASAAGRCFDRIGPGDVSGLVPEPPKLPPPSRCNPPSPTTSVSVLAAREHLERIVSNVSSAACERGGLHSASRFFAFLFGSRAPRPPPSGCAMSGSLSPSSGGSALFFAA